MDKQEKFADDILKDYLAPETKVKAPEGFTSNIMSRIMVEPLPSSISQKQRRRNPVPFVSALIFTAFVLAAFLIGGNGEQTSLPIASFLNSIRINIPTINLSLIKGFVMPEWLVYLAVSILLLTIFDIVLYELFHKEENDSGLSNLKGNKGFNLF